MCLSLSELHQAMSAYAAGFDAALVAPAELPAVVEHAGAIEKMAAALASMAAGRLARVGKAGSEQGAAERLSKATGTSQAQARRAVGTARRMASQPEVAEAARRGELSWDQAELVSQAAEVNPSATGGLLRLAKTAPLSELAGEAARQMALAEDLEARRQRAHRERSLRQWADAGGTWHLHAHGLPEDGARVMAALQRLSERCSEEARREGRRERPEAYAYDALVRLATGQGAAQPGYEVMVRVDFETLLRGYPVDGETCEVAGFGPVPAKVVRDIMEGGNPFLKAVLTKGEGIVGVAHLGRRPNAHQKSALDWLFPTCAAEGCGVRAGFLQSDHRVEWAKAHVTVFDLLDRLCRRHHALKTHEGWSLVEGRGKRAFVPPGDPRHPGAGPPPGQPGPPPVHTGRPGDPHNSRAHPETGPPTAA
jgi:hypothetical protein